LINKRIGSNDDAPGRQQPRSATLQDVADRAGVSRSTASSVLNGACATTRTSEATRERVRQVAAELAYRPNAIARSLRRSVAHTIGFYNGFGYIDARNPFLSALLAGLHFQCDHHACDLLIHRVSDRADKYNQIQEIISGKVDGVIVYTENHDPVVDLLVARQFPAVAIADEHPLLPSVTADDEGASRLIARRLAAKGHKRVLYRVPPINRNSAFRRCHSFTEEARALGMHVDIGVSSDFLGAPSVDEMALLNGPEELRPTALACWNDGNAIQAYMWFDHRFAIVGFDGFEHPGLPTLTTVQVPWDTIGVTAVDVLRRVIEGQSVPHETLVPVSIIEGETG
jgi:LacI family transcriptional regulator